MLEHLTSQGQAACRVWAGGGGDGQAEDDGAQDRDRQQLGELMALVTEKATVAVAVKPEKTESKVAYPLCENRC